MLNICISIMHPSLLLHKRVMFYHITQGYHIPAGKDTVAKFLSWWSGAVINIF